MTMKEELERLVEQTRTCSSMGVWYIRRNLRNRQEMSPHEHLQMMQKILVAKARGLASPLDLDALDEADSNVLSEFGSTDDVERRKQLFEKLYSEPEFDTLDPLFDDFRQLCVTDHQHIHDVARKKLNDAKAFIRQRFADLAAEKHEIDDLQTYVAGLIEGQTESFHNAPLEQQHLMLRRDAERKLLEMLKAYSKSMRELLAYGKTVWPSIIRAHAAAGLDRVYQWSVQVEATMKDMRITMDTKPWQKIIDRDVNEQKLLRLNLLRSKSEDDNSGISSPPCILSFLSYSLSPTFVRFCIHLLMPSCFDLK